VPVFVGLISYPLYLWHWPLLALVPILDVAWSGSEERLAKLVALAVAIVAAYLTYRWIESPVRQQGRVSVSSLCIAMCLPFLAGSTIAIAHWRASAPSNRQQLEIARQLALFQEQRAPLFRDRRCFLDADQDETAFAPECTAELERRSGGGTLLWGDSHAAHLAPGILARGAASGFAQLSATSCPPILGYSARGRPYCKRLNDWILEWVTQHRPHTILLAAAWPSYDGYQGIASTVEALKGLGVARVVIVGPFVSFRERVPEVLARESTPDAVPERLASTRLERLRRVDTELRTIAANAGGDYVSPLDLSCNAQGCLVAAGGTARGLLIFDQSHLMPAGSRIVADRLLAPYLR
jgi:hypothetical protein